MTAIVPAVSRELGRWQAYTDKDPLNPLLKQAAASIQHKRFHCLGGSFYALYNRPFSKQLVSAIVALQTISDYLDNLCDRAGLCLEEGFRSLHYSFLEALTPNSGAEKLGAGSAENYYQHYPYQQDGGYLQALVKECQRQLITFPSYQNVLVEINKLAERYCELQIKKHLDPDNRRFVLEQWVHETAEPIEPNIYWWEYAAACGSTLGIFALLSLSTRSTGKPEDSKIILDAYFPWICGLHILLDYYIDQQEDIRGGDFNFVACYPSAQETERRLHLFLEKAQEKATLLPEASFHRTIVSGLPAVYLSDPKVKQQGFQPIAQRLIRRAGPKTELYYRLCLLLRRIKIL